jgi:hypothetical protein
VVLIVVTVTTIFRLCYKDIQFFDGCARQVLYKTVVLVLANRDQMRYNESKWGTQMDGLRVDVIVLT